MKPSATYSHKILVGARNSPLSRAQLLEVEKELQRFSPEISFLPIFTETYGDKDRKTSLRTLDKTDFFTREIDQMLLRGTAEVAIHSAKDLPEPLPKGLEMIALTEGVDPSDSLVFQKGKTLETVEVVATSSERREEMVKKLRNDVKFIDIRGKIEERLEKLEKGEADAVVIAEAALIRLNLSPPRIKLPDPAAPLQGRLAVLAREGDDAMRKLFKPLDKR